jgi:hypothetical protein
MELSHKERWWSAEAVGGVEDGHNLVEDRGQAVVLRVRTRGRTERGHPDPSVGPIRTEDNGVLEFRLRLRRG